MDFARLFRYYDRDNSGVIDKDEFISLCGDGKIPPQKMSNDSRKVVRHQTDTDGGGVSPRSSFVDLGKEQWVPNP